MFGPRPARKIFCFCVVITKPQKEKPREKQTEKIIATAQKIIKGKNILTITKANGYT